MSLFENTKVDLSQGKSSNTSQISLKSKSIKSVLVAVKDKIKVTSSDFFTQENEVK